MNNYKWRIKSLEKKYSRDTNLTKAQSNEIINSECPYCDFYMDCNRIKFYGKGNQKFQLCRIRSCSTEKVWLDITEKTRPEVKIGDVYGKLTVEEYGGYDSGRHPMWVCRCECGNTKRVLGFNLISGNTSSCGCQERKRNDLTAMRTKTLTNEENKIKTRYRRGSSRNTDGSRHQYPSEHSSKTNQQVDDLLTIRDESDPYNPETNCSIYLARRCDECGGIIRYDDHGFKTCEECGLINSVIVLDNEYDVDRGLKRFQKSLRDM